MAQNPVPAEGAAELQLQSQLTDLTTQRNTLATSLNTVTLDQLQQPHVQQLTQPYLVSGKVSPKPMQAGLAGALAGIMIAALTVGLLIRRLLKRQPDHVG